MKLYLVDPHDTRLYKNGLFNPTFDPNFIIWVKIKKILLSKNILLDTIDLHPINKADKIFFFDHNKFTLFNSEISPYLRLCLESRISKNKLNLIITECPIIKPYSWIKNNHLYYGKVFTWNDSLVDNKKYFHYLWLQNFENKKPNKVPFKKKKLITLINARKTNYSEGELYSLRNSAIEYFQNKFPNNFDLFGVGWNKLLNIKFIYSILNGNFLKLPIFLTDFLKSLIPLRSYKGVIENKLEVLSKYKFCICFENMKNIDGYITEKIFFIFSKQIQNLYFESTSNL